MLKILNRLAIFVFFLVAALAPYVSVKGAALAFAQNPEEKVETKNTFEEKLSHDSVGTMLYITLDVTETSFPLYIALKPQLVVDDFHKPPLA